MMSQYKLKKGDQVLMQGSLRACWEELLRRYGLNTRKYRQIFNIRIEK